VGFGAQRDPPEGGAAPLADGESLHGPGAVSVSRDRSSRFRVRPGFVPSSSSSLLLSVRWVTEETGRG